MDIGASFRKGILYTAIGKYSNVIIQLVVTAILSRILRPEEYGLVALVNVFLIFFQMLADFGIGPAVIQRKDLTHSDMESIFSLTLYIAVIFSLLFAGLGYPISLLYHKQIYQTLFLLLGICVFFYTATIVPQANLNKQMEFKTVNGLILLANLLSGVLGIFFAVMGFGLYALVVSNIAKASLMFIGFYRKSPIKFAYQIEKEALIKIFDFAKFQFLFNFINYFARNLDNLLIGGVFNPKALGYYDKAYQLSLYPNQVLSQVVTPAIHPIMSHFENEKERMAKVYLVMFRVMIMLGIPLSVFLYLNAREVIVFMYGGYWLDSVPVFRLLALSIWMQMANSFSGAFYQSSNQTSRMFRVGLWTSGANILAILIGVIAGSLQAVASMLLISFAFSLVVNIYQISKNITGIPFLHYGKIVSKHLLLNLPYIVFYHLLSLSTSSIFLKLFIQFALFVVVWLVGIIVSREYRFFTSFVKQSRK